ncbi:hypothetical protein SLA2020_413830 [Shorea laevis]
MGNIGSNSNGGSRQRHRIQPPPPPMTPLATILHCVWLERWVGGVLQWLERWVGGSLGGGGGGWRDTLVQ